MQHREMISAAALAAMAGLALAQPATVDGVKGPGEPYVLLWAQNQPTSFGDAVAGQFTGGDFGDPENVTTGVELSIPLASLGITGSSTIRLSGWVNSGDRTFKSNQIIGSLPIDTNNLGNPPTDFTAAPFDTTTQHISVNLASVATATPTIDGTRDGAYTLAFLQGNYTGFGNETDGTVDGTGPNGGGSEIDGVYMAKNATTLFIFIAGNLEANGNAMDIYIDTGAGGDNTLDSGSGAGAFIIDGQSGVTFDAGFDADYVLSVDTWDHDSDGNTVNLPRAWFGPINGSIDDLGTVAAWGAASALSGSVSMAIDNSNIAGVIGSPSQASPVSPDSNWAYGSEIDNVHAYIDNNKLYLLIGGNTQINGNKINFFLDVDGPSEGQNPLRTDNIDISFNGLNRMGGLIWDSGFTPDYWFNVNTNVDGGTGNLQNFTDAATLRTDGPLFDAFLGAILDYGAYFGGAIETATGTPVAMPTELMDFSGPLVDIQDGSKASLFTNYAPRTTQLDPMNPVPGLIQTAIDNSNVAGVSDTSADGACEVMTGIEVCIDLDEAGWDGVSDILLAGFVNAGGFDFASNQWIGGLPGSPAANLGDPALIDLTTIAGDQFINITDLLLSGGIGCATCPCDTDGNGMLTLDDIDGFIAGFFANTAAGDCNGDGLWTLDDIDCFTQCFLAGCP